jgi:predicted dinucleotide-binding enzyme
MKIAVVGTGFIGGILGRALAGAGHEVVFGSRHPDDDKVAAESAARVLTVGAAIEDVDVIVLALPGEAVEALVAAHGDAFSGQLVVDATNQFGAPVAHSRAVLPGSVRYARAFNTLGGENMEDPVFRGVRADMFFSAPEADRMTVEAVIEGVGLRPVFVGEDQEAVVDGVLRLWASLAMGQGRGRRLAFRVLED